ncbi:MAG: CoA transferase [Chloroflexi bacterium]|nr:CoA transferase [Chloroflexota bacterium]
MNPSLAGVQVVALEQAVAAPLCTRHLADLGADVIKIERPGSGDFARRYDSVVHGQSAYFVWLNYGKRSLSLDLQDAADREQLEALLAVADVFVHNLGPGAVDRLGLGWTELHARWPRLISCAISGYGEDGPYRERKAFDLLLQGESAVTAITGTPEAPAKVGISIADISAAMYALSAILSALYGRLRTGAGERIEISMLECLAEWMSPALLHQAYGGRTPARTGLRHNLIVPYGPYAGINLAVQNEGQWQRLCTLVLERPDLIDDARFATNERRVQHRAELEPEIERLLAGHPRPTILERLQRADVPFGSLNEVEDVLRHPQLAARQRWQDVDTEGGPARLLVSPLATARTRAAVPRLGTSPGAGRRGVGTLSSSAEGGPHASQSPA